RNAQTHPASDLPIRNRTLLDLAGASRDGAPGRRSRAGGDLATTSVPAEAWWSRIQGIQRGLRRERVFHRGPSHIERTLVQCSRIPRDGARGGGLLALIARR